MKLTLVIILLLSTLASYSQARPFAYGQDKRRYTVYLPAAYHQSNNQAFPVVFNFHGSGMTMTEQMFYTGMNEAAEKYQFIVVYPQGIKQDWNVGFEMSYQQGSDDIGFVKALMAHLTKTYRVDSTMVYATGLSRGGFFCHRLAAELPEMFAAVASVGAPIPDSVVFFHKKKLPVSVMMVHGTEDRIVEYEGKKGAYYSNRQTFDYWRKHNGLMTAPEIKDAVDLLPGDSTSVDRLETTAKGLSVLSVAVKNGGHTWPGRHPFNIGFDLGKTSREIDVNEWIWAFFKKHKRE